MLRITWDRFLTAADYSNSFMDPTKKSERNGFQFMVNFILFCKKKN